MDRDLGRHVIALLGIADDQTTRLIPCRHYNVIQGATSTISALDDCLPQKLGTVLAQYSERNLPTWMNKCFDFHRPTAGAKKVFRQTDLGRVGIFLGGRGDRDLITVRDTRFVVPEAESRKIERHPYPTPLLHNGGPAVEAAPIHRDGPSATCELRDLRGGGHGQSLSI